MNSRLQDARAVILACRQRDSEHALDVVKESVHRALIAAGYTNRARRERAVDRAIEVAVEVARERAR